MNLKFDKVEDKIIIRLIGELDHHSAEEVRVKIDDRIERENIKKIIMDFSSVSFMDSSGIGVVVGRFKKISQRDGKLYIAGLKKGIYKVFELSGLFKIINCCKDVEEALKRI
ncbi:anti-anti-sigma regulatory factor, SpoIIAA [Clostridium sp. DSM 8431]|uniref:anti-sigma F factor antagonist n=1 Tax=Clostridium sp. DSM 8431 TaxID=1761781 RepID=UPI0008E8CEDD|nr:anti-sigma F factor antagonist [Clostridium sp. DSM 8431]SFU31266.1 anti-anti-sigma regulatory factor, SpoIIAA [Clostridium sp. DSM 8431]